MKYLFLSYLQLFSSSLVQTAVESAQETEIQIDFKLWS